MAGPTLSTYDVAVLEVLFTSPAGPIMATSIADFIHVRVYSLSLLSENILAKKTVVVEEDRRPLDLDRLRDAHDSNSNILFDPEQKIVVREFEYVLGMPPLE